MKHLKLYEELNTDLPEVDDYAIIKVLNAACAKDSIDFIESNIGQIVNDNDNHYQIMFDTQYDYTNSLGEKGKSNSYWADENEILYYSTNKEELELKLAARKYNL